MRHQSAGAGASAWHGFPNPKLSLDHHTTEIPQLECRTQQTEWANPAVLSEDSLPPPSKVFRRPDPPVVPQSNVRGLSAYGVCVGGVGWGVMGGMG